ncbi:hypothetical protein L596_023859 [Steinernema carpocapsae]|uniref:RWD domain-containing protein n=1 Tax=Steinernema carpocapsae TaxID=34508 RepID=A0A4U5MEZ7_STECR|nr:hypothetical protein L596_023859 [Steinernema carpocapsae]
MYNADELILGSRLMPVDFRLILSCGEHNYKVELSFQLPTNYPSAARPNVLIRSLNLNETEANRNLKSFIDDLPLGEAVIHEVIAWVQDNVKEYEVPEEVQVDVYKIDESEDTLYRMWIFSHHLYSITKRRDILTLTKRFDLRGMAVPGKPAIIVVEGWKKACGSFWEQVRSWNWQKIFVKHEEAIDTLSSLGKFRELILESANGKSGDLSQLRDVLEEHGLGVYFRKMFDLC